MRWRAAWIPSRVRGAAAAGRSGLGEQQLEVGRGRHQRVVDAVVQRDGHLADGGEPLRPYQVPLGGAERLPELPAPAHALEHLGQHLEQGLVLGQVVVGAQAEGGWRRATRCRAP